MNETYECNFDPQKISLEFYSSSRLLNDNSFTIFYYKNNVKFSEFFHIFQKQAIASGSMSLKCQIMLLYNVPYIVHLIHSTMKDLPKCITILRRVLEQQFSST
jgi:hypothetical protein